MVAISTVTAYLLMDLTIIKETSSKSGAAEELHLTWPKRARGQRQGSSLPPGNMPACTEVTPKQATWCSQSEGFGQNFGTEGRLEDSVGKLF